MTAMIDTPAVGLVWHLMPCPSGYLIEWERPDGTWCHVNSAGRCFRYDADDECWIRDGVPDDTDKGACYGRLVPLDGKTDANPYSRGTVKLYKVGRVGDLLPCAEDHFVEWQRGVGWFSAGPGIRFAPDEYDKACLGRVVPRTEAAMSAHKRGPVTVRVPAPPEHPTFEATSDVAGYGGRIVNIVDLIGARVVGAWVGNQLFVDTDKGTLTCDGGWILLRSDATKSAQVAPAFEAAPVGVLLSRELPPGSWVEWSDLESCYDGGEPTLVWYKATAACEWLLMGAAQRWVRLNREIPIISLRSLGRLVPAGSDPDPTSRGPITGGGS